MTAPASLPPATLSRFGAPSDVLDAGLVPERPEPPGRAARGLYLTDREKWLTRHLTRAMTPRVLWTLTDDSTEPNWPVKRDGCGWYATYAAISGYCGIEPLSRLRLDAREFVRVMNDVGRTAEEASDAIRGLVEAGPPIASHRGDRSFTARALAWCPS